MNVHMTHITSSVLGIHVNDTDLDLFESQYPVPGGVSYNSYLIRDDKTAVLTVCTTTSLSIISLPLLISLGAAAL